MSGFLDFFQGLISTKTKAIKNTTLPQHKKYQAGTSPDKRSGQLGIDGDHLKEGVPLFINAPSEKVIQSEGNSWIVLGRDRPSTRSSGYMGTGDTHASSIDIVAGRMGYKASAYREMSPDFVGPPGVLETDVDFFADSARIYISQKTDIDDNFKLPRGKVGTSVSKSGIALKADAIRIIAREGIKLVTRTDHANSQGSDVLSVTGVDIIAGNDDSELQPMVKGENLIKALSRLSRHVVALNGIMESFLLTQMDYNKAISEHYHISPFFGVPTTTAPGIPEYEGPKTLKNQLTRVQRSLKTNKENLGAWQSSYLKSSDKKYICSTWNNVN